MADGHKSDIKAVTIKSNHAACCCKMFGSFAVAFVRMVHFTKCDICVWNTCTNISELQISHGIFDLICQKL